MDENLLGYLLGALDGPEHDEFRDQLERDPDLREQLAVLETRLAPLERERWQFEPPEGLAVATCEFVAKRAAQVTLDRPRTSASRSTMSEWNPRKHGWDVVDMVVAAGIFLAASLLFFPAIANSRDAARQLACQNKLRANAWACSAFADRHLGVLPFIPSQGKAGVAGYYAPQLMDGGYLTSHASILCPSSAMAADSRSHFIIPTADQVHAADGEELMQLQQTMGGSYMYTMGHRNGGFYRSTRNRGRSYFPIMSDSIQSPMILKAGAVSGHGEGVNVVFEGGNVRFLIGASRQHPFFVSHRGLVEAGANEEDAVLGHSWDRPCPNEWDGEPTEGSGQDLESALWKDLNTVSYPGAL